MSLKAIIDLPDDWERGHCWNCSIGYLDDDYIHYCPYRCRGKCELKVEDSEGENGIMKEAKLVIDGKEYTVQMKDKDIKAVTRPKTGYTFVDEGDYYYSVNVYDKVRRSMSSSNETESDMDEPDLYNIGNYYSDYQLALDIARADKLYRRLRQWQALNDKPVDYWNDSGLPKYSIFYSHRNKSIVIEPNYNCETFGTIHFSSSDVAEVAIEEFKDELIWYFTKFKQRLDG